MSEQSELPTLPLECGQLPVRHLSCVFDKVNSGYKHCFFKALLNLTCEGKMLDQVSLDEIRREMLAVAWIPRLVYHLNFGKNDELGTVLNALGKESRWENTKTDYEIDDIRRLVRKFEPMMFDPSWPVDKSHYNNLIRYPPYRFLTPWFEKELEGLDDTYKNKKIADLSNILFEQYKPLYRFTQRFESQNIVLHMSPEWLAYLRDNYFVVLDWLNKKWLGYLKPFNPDVPNLVDKLWAFESRRSSLTVQRNFWQPVLAEGFECIYSGDEVHPRNFALDHFLPWSCVAHDRLWNLVPTLPEVNGDKSDYLPNEHHVGQLAKAHMQAVKSNMPLRTPGDTCLDEYIEWLGDGISFDKFDERRFQDRFSNKMNEHLHKARKLGYETMSRTRGL